MICTISSCFEEVSGNSVYTVAMYSSLLTIFILACFSEESIQKEFANSSAETVNPLKEESSPRQNAPSSDRKETITKQNQAIFELDRKRDKFEQPTTKANANDYEIFLMDGSILRGEILNIEHGEWKINSSNLGLLSISATKVLKIQKIGLDSTPNAQRTEYRPAHKESGIQENNMNLAQIESLQNSLTSDPSTIMGISQLQSNTAVMSVLADPEVMSLMQQGDLTALQQHPKMQALMNDPSILQVLGMFNP
jgi:hypothetical protein